MGGLASIGEREENRYRTILGRPGVSNVGISFIEFRHGFNPSPLIIHTDLQLAGINIGLPSVNDSLHISDPNEGGSQNGYYRSAVMVNSLEQPHNPKPFFLFRRSLAMGLIAQGDTADRTDPPPEASTLPDVPTQELLVQVSGMWCTSCAWLIEHVLKKERGVVSVRASFASDLANVTHCPQYLPPQRVLELIQGLGYGAHEYSGEQETAEADKRDLLVRLGLAAFLWANIMSLSLVIYAGYFEPIAASIRHYLPFLLMALATPVVYYCGQPILKLAWRGLLHGAIRMEALLALGICSAYLYSSAQAIRGGAASLL